ncbi:hypothetical protein [Streptomyces sp. NPDC002952]|uniref:hypothetical protein n=1 Tax=Streptomyces sp. NPDC002952 TaxID=3364673 RepID=UPI003690D2C4
MTISTAHHDGRHESHSDRGTFGTLLQLRRERKQREARAAREARLVELTRSIDELEAWHHAWRLEHDEGYRALHPGEWCERHRGMVGKCGWMHLRRSADLREHEITTWSGAVIRRELGYNEPVLTLEERQRATRRVVQWAGEQFGNG